MSDQPQHKSSLAIDEEIERLSKAGETIAPAILHPANGGKDFSPWMDNAFKEAQANVDRLHGRIPQKVDKQPNPAVSSHQSKWQSSMNNTRELGPGDVKKGR